MIGSPPKAACAVIVSAIAHIMSSSPLYAKVCWDQSVSARGEPSRLQWLARTKTKANWRAKVRALPGLGDEFAKWERAEDATEHCVSGPSGTICDFSGVPCRKE